MRERRMTPLVAFPFGIFTMLRFEYELLTQGDVVQALILRILEQRIEEKRKRRYDEIMNESEKQPDDLVLNVPREYWIALSHINWMYDLRQIVKSETTLKKKLKGLVSRKLILERVSSSKDRYASREYTMNWPVVEAEFAKMRELRPSGYQCLIPSSSAILNDSSGDQKLFLSGDQSRVSCLAAKGAVSAPFREPVSDPNSINREKETSEEEVTRERNTHARAELLEFFGCSEEDLEVIKTLWQEKQGARGENKDDQCPGQANEDVKQPGHRGPEGPDVKQQSEEWRGKPGGIHVIEHIVQGDQEDKILLWWDEIMGTKQPRLTESRQAAKALLEVGATKEKMQQVLDGLFAQKDGFWRGIAVRLKHIVSNWGLASEITNQKRTKAAPTLMSALASPPRERKRLPRKNEESALPAKVNDCAQMSITVVRGA